MSAIITMVFNFWRVTLLHVKSPSVAVPRGLFLFADKKNNRSRGAAS